MKTDPEAARIIDDLLCQERVRTGKWSETPPAVRGLEYVAAAMEEHKIWVTSALLSLLAEVAAEDGVDFYERFHRAAARRRMR